MTSSRTWFQLGMVSVVLAGIMLVVLLSLINILFATLLFYILSGFILVFLLTGIGCCIVARQMRRQVRLKKEREDFLKAIYVDFKRL